MRIVNDVITTAQDFSVSYSSPAFSLKHMTGFSIVAALTGGSPTGTLKLQASDDKAENTLGNESNSTPTTWVDITLPVTSVVSITATGNTLWNYSNAYYKWVRVVWTVGSAAGTTATITINGKGF